MGIMAYLSSFLAASHSASYSTSTTRSFTLEVWLDNSPLNNQAISWIPTSESRGFFGIPIRSPASRLPVKDRAIFTLNSSSPDSLFFSPPGSEINKVFVQASGEIEYGLEIPVEYFKPYTGNFSTVDFMHWPDLETVESLAFTPPGFILGVFLACPRDLGEEKGYQLVAMTPMFKHGGCITLDWVVYRNVEGEMVGVKVAVDVEGKETLQAVAEK